MTIETAETGRAMTVTEETDIATTDTTTCSTTPLDATHDVTPVMTIEIGEIVTTMTDTVTVPEVAVNLWESLANPNGSDKQ